VGITRIESNRNRHFGLKIESKSIENRNLEIVTSLGTYTNTHDIYNWIVHCFTSPPTQYRLTYINSTMSTWQTESNPDSLR